MFDQRKRNQDLYEGAMAQAAYDGEQKGINQRNREIVLNMVKNAMDMPTIMLATGLTESEITAIVKQGVVQ